ncbi:MAG TPA: helix-turn-helix domain-containing protein [Acidimicrobiia bacterium]
MTGARVHVVDSLEALQVLGHPMRVRILEALREPASAASVARALGEGRQRVNYHLKELERVGLVEAAGTQRVGNFVETRYRAAGNAFVVAPEVVWADPRRAEALREQQSLERLVMLGGRVQRDAAALLDAAAFDGEEIASASVEVDVHFRDEGERAAFLDEYVQLVRELCDRYGARAGDPYRVAMAAYPGREPSEGGDDG